ncbi:MAG: SHOCT domain-containing protein [Acidimicrobiales bacterium]|jgi:hypothetical protein|nr:SHOCT domain-containing protein [Acidimicrobiales bacterium]
MGLLKTAAKVAVASSVHGRVQRRQQQRWAAQDAAAGANWAGAARPLPPPPMPAPPAAAPVAAPPAPAPSTTDMAQQVELLRQLGELRDSGVLTEEEFAAKKAEILG